MFFITKLFIIKSVHMLFFSALPASSRVPRRERCVEIFLMQNNGEFAAFIWNLETSEPYLSDADAARRDTAQTRVIQSAEAAS